MSRMIPFGSIQTEIKIEKALRRKKMEERGWGGACIGLNENPVVRDCAKAAS